LSQTPPIQGYDDEVRLVADCHLSREEEALVDSVGGDAEVIDLYRQALACEKAFQEVSIGLILLHTPAPPKGIVQDNDTEGAGRALWHELAVSKA
jgi:hypothetical protein